MPSSLAMDGGSGPTTNELCTGGAQTAGSRTEVVRDGFGTPVATFEFTQLRYTAPTPCNSNLDMYLTISSQQNTTLSFSYSVQFLSLSDGSTQGSHTGSVFGLAPFGAVDEGLVFRPNVNLQYLGISIYAQP